MKRLYLLPALLALGGFLLFGAGQANAAACPTGLSQSGTSQYYEPSYGVSSGAWIWVYARAEADDCVGYITPIVPLPYLSDSSSESSEIFTADGDGNGIIPVITRAQASASLSGKSVSASLFEYNYSYSYAQTKASPHIVDLLYFKVSNYDPYNKPQVPVTFCSEYNSVEAGGGGYTRVGLSGVTWDTGGSSIIHNDSGKICQSGHITVSSASYYSSLSLKAFLSGTTYTEELTVDGTTYNVGVLEGEISGYVDIGDLPDGVSCSTGSGNSCKRVVPESKIAGAEDVNQSKDKPDPCQVASNDAGDGAAGNTSGNNVNAFSGNPINYALGYKYQSENDYSGGLLSFTRVYRSDSTWTSDVIGSRWRHNFDRVFSVSSSPFVDNDRIDITDSSGALTAFRERTGGTWEAVDIDITSTLENSYDSSSVHDGYVYTTNGDTREYYDLAGLLQRIEYNGGEALDFTYDGSNRLSSVTNEQGKSLTFSYNGSSKIASVVTPTGTYSYSYDGNGNLTSVTKPDSKTRTYHYENASFANALTGITDEKGVRFATYGYDANGLAISSKHAGDVGEYLFSYNSDGTTTVTNPLGKDTIYTFQTINGVRKITDVAGQASTSCVAANKSYTYDARGFMDSKTDWKGNVTTYSYDSLGSVASITEDAYGSAYRNTTATYIAGTRLPDVVTETGKTTDYDYDADGRVTSITVTDTATAETRTTTYSYNANTTDTNGNVVLGKLASVDGSRTDVSDITSFTYDANKRLIKVTNALGHESEILTFDAANRPLTIKDANGVITTLVYDALGRLTSSTKDSATTTYSYDANGNVLSITDPSNVVITYAYDNAQRLTGITDALGNSITYTLDNAGNITKEEYKDTSATLKYTASAVYDELSRILDSVDANLDKTTLVYDVNSNVTSVTDGNFNATTYAYDGLDRLVSYTDALAAQAARSVDELDHTNDVTDPRNNATTYTYNAFGDRLTEVSPDRGTITYSYDAGGNITSKTDARGVVVNYAYDAIDRITSISYPSDSSLDVAVTYDTASGCGTSIGRLCSVSDASGTASYVYDAKGQVTSVTETRGALSFVTSYSYDASGSLTSITLPSGRVVTYALDGNGDVTSVSAVVNSTSTSLASSITYLPFGGVTGLTYGNGLTLTNTHNNAYQLTNRSIGSMLNDSYTYDAANNITVKGSTSYSYDVLYRLTGENSDTYSYDAIANRLSENVGGNTQTYTYPSTSSRLSAIGASSITTDAAGNITTDATRSYTIDAAGHIKDVSIGGSVVGAYVYDAANLRTQKTVGTIVTHYVYGKGGKLYGEYDASGNMLVEYVYLHGNPLAQVDSGEVLSYLHTDHLGTPRYATNTAGVQVWNWSSDAFGNGAPTGSATVNLRFAGQYWDNESSLHYNWNRYYDPATGRYLTSDPIGLAGGLNTYAYALANPVMHIDPEGLFVETIWDVANVGYDIANGQWGDAVWDTCAVIIPGLPAGLSKLDDIAGVGVDAVKTLKKGPKPNNGIAKKHGAKPHDKAIDDLVGDLKQDPSVTNIRKNQQQVDVDGNKVGLNRPDVQFDQNNCHHCVEFDNVPKKSVEHGKVIKKNDPNTKVDLNILVPKKK